MKACIEISIEDAFTVEERLNFEANARLAGRDISSHLRAILFPPAVVESPVSTTATKALARDCRAGAAVKSVKGNDGGRVVGREVGV